MIAKNLRLAALCCALVSLGSFAHPQPQKAFPYYVEWEAIDGAGGYRVEARDPAGTIVFTEGLESTNTNCDIVLPPGRYAFRIVTLNKFLRMENATDWIPFVVEAYTAPIVTKVAPASVLTDSPISLKMTADRVSTSVSAWLLSPSGIKIPLKIAKRKNGSFSLTGSPLTEKGPYSLFLSNPPNLVTQKKNILAARYPNPTVISLDPQILENGAHTLRLTGKNFSPESSVFLARRGEDAHASDTTVTERSPTVLTVSVSSQLEAGEYSVFIANDPTAAKVIAGTVVVPGVKPATTGHEAAIEPDHVAAPDSTVATDSTVTQNPAVAADSAVAQNPAVAANDSSDAKEPKPFSLPQIKKISLSGGGNLNVCFADWQGLYPWPTITGHGAIDFYLTNNLRPEHGPALDFSLGFRCDVLHAERERDSTYVNSTLTSVSALVCPAATVSFRHFRAKAYAGIGACRSALVMGMPTGTASEEVVSFDLAYAAGINLEYPIFDWLACGISNQFWVIQTTPPILLYTAAVYVSVYIP